jgi:hypothetical protein
MRLSTFLAATLLGGCATSWSHQPLTEEERQSIASAETFVVRNGYTTAGHPAGLPVQNVEVLDVLATSDELTEWRRGTLRSRAFGIVRAAPSAYYVLFDRLAVASENEVPTAVEEQHAGHKEFRAVLVQHAEAVQVVHSMLLFEEGDWKPNDR